MSIGILALVVLLVLVGLLISGVPIAFALLGIATVGILYVWGPMGLLALFNTAYGEGTSFLLLAIPLLGLLGAYLGNFKPF